MSTGNIFEFYDGNCLLAVPPWHVSKYLWGRIFFSVPRSMARHIFSFQWDDAAIALQSWLFFIHASIHHMHAMHAGILCAHAILSCV
jgi:hypothetical protein